MWDFNGNGAASWHKTPRTGWAGDDTVGVGSKRLMFSNGLNNSLGIIFKLWV